MKDQSEGGRLRELSARATVGADRAGGGASAAGDLLALAACLGARARAGYRAPLITARLVGAPPDARPVAGQAALATLGRLLSEPDGALIEEWARLAHGAGVRVDGATAPLLLDWWARQPRRSPVVFAVLGEHGAWLAGLNDSWRKPTVGETVPENADALWQTGAASERTALLSTIRSHDPARAESMVRSTWKSDPADERRRFVEQFSIGLSMADEPFLESVLDDKSKLVRAAAADLLARLPASRFAARMALLARAMIGVEPAKKGIIRKSAARVTIEPPAEFDAAWERDGIEEKPPGGVGKRAWWMRQIVARTTPAMLISTEVAAPEFLSAAAETEYHKDLIEALSHSSVATADPGWCAAVLRHRLDRKTSHAAELAPLWQALAPAPREETILDLLTHANVTWSERWAMLGACRHPWSPGFGARACAVLKDGVPAKPPDWYLIGQAVDEISRSIDPAGVAGFEAAIAAVFRDNVPPSIVKSLDRVRLRADMLKEFAS
jgi:hypothetical protein